MISNNNIITTSNLHWLYLQSDDDYYCQNPNLNLQAGKLIVLIGSKWNDGNQPCFEHN
jgi:hypothetical protein